MIDEFVIVNVGDRWHPLVPGLVTRFSEAGYETNKHAEAAVNKVLGDGDWGREQEAEGLWRYRRRKPPPSDAERVARELFKSDKRFNYGWTEDEFVKQVAPLIATVAEPADELYKAALAENNDGLRRKVVTERANRDYWCKRFQHVRVIIESCAACHLKVIRDALAWEPGTTSRTRNTKD